MSGKSPLTYKVLSKCSRSKARRGILTLRETKPVDTPGMLQHFKDKKKLRFSHSDFSFHACWYARNSERSFGGPAEAGQHELPDYVEQHLPLGTPARSGDSEESRRVAQVHGMGSRAADRLGRLPDGVAAATC